MKYPFQAVLFQYVDVVAAERLNIGIALLCFDRGYISCRFVESFQRISGAFPGADFMMLRRISKAIQDMCGRWVDEMLLRPKNLAEIVRTTMPHDDSALQASDVIGGITSDPEETLRQLFFALVSRSEEDKPKVQRRDETAVWRDFAGKFPKREYTRKLSERVVRSKHAELRFPYAWKNGQWNVAQPLSLDLFDKNSIELKAMDWSGRILTVRPKEHGTNVVFVVGMPPPDRPKELLHAAEQALEILNDNLASTNQAEVVCESNADALVQRIVTDIDAHQDDPPATETE